MAFSSGVFKEKGFVPHGKKMNFSPCLNIGKCCLLLEVLPLVVWARKGIPIRALPPSGRFVARARCGGAFFLGQVVTDGPVIMRPFSYVAHSTFFN